jgi:protein-S-isoprenylcysteine O-methyltransferase Ste14
MTLFPLLKLGWLNGWIPGLLFYGIFIILLKIFPKETVDRLYDDTGWTIDQARLAKIGLPFALSALILLPFTSLKYPLPVFWTGLVLYLVGFAGFVYSLHTFNTTPLDKPATRGLYSVSRNPQWVTFAATLIGIRLMVGSWTIFLLVSVRIIMNHFRILGEERALEKQYGKSYLDYKKSIPRYMLFF